MCHVHRWAISWYAQLHRCVHPLRSEDHSWLPGISTTYVSNVMVSHWTMVQRLYSYSRQYFSGKKKLYQHEPRKSNYCFPLTWDIGQMKCGGSLFWIDRSRSIRLICSESCCSRFALRSLADLSSTVTTSRCIISFSTWLELDFLNACTNQTPVIHIIQIDTFDLWVYLMACNIPYFLIGKKNVKKYYHMTRECWFQWRFCLGGWE